MSKWIEYEDSYACEIRRESNMHPKSIFEVDLEDGVIATFGEPKSKLHSKRFKLIDVYFLKEFYTLDEAYDWWRFYDVRYINGKHRGKKLPEVAFGLGAPGDLVAGGFIFVCVRNTRKDKTVAWYLDQVEEN